MDMDPHCDLDDPHCDLALEDSHCDLDLQDSNLKNDCHTTLGCVVMHLKTNSINFSCKKVTGNMGES